MEGQLDSPTVVLLYSLSLSDMTLPSHAPFVNTDRVPGQGNQSTSAFAPSQYARACNPAVLSAVAECCAVSLQQL